MNTFSLSQNPSTVAGQSTNDILQMAMQAVTLSPEEEARLIERVSPYAPLTTQLFDLLQEEASYSQMVDGTSSDNVSETIQFIEPPLYGEPLAMTVEQLEGMLSNLPESMRENFRQIIRDAKANYQQDANQIDHVTSTHQTAMLANFQRQSIYRQITPQESETALEKMRELGFSAKQALWVSYNNDVGSLILHAYTRQSVSDQPDPAAMEIDQTQLFPEVATPEAVFDVSSRMIGHGGSESVVQRLAALSSISKKRKGNLPPRSVAILENWLLTHFSCPYPSDEDKSALAMQTGLSIQQIQTWMTNKRARVWKRALDSLPN